MTLTARHHRQRAQIDAGLQRGDPHLARLLALPSARIGRRGLTEVLTPMAVNVTGLVMLVVGALLHRTTLAVTGLFLGASGPLVSVVAFRVMNLRRARSVFSRQAVR